MKKIYFFVLLLAATNAGLGQTTYTWNQTGTASWAVSTNWTPTRTTPAANDILVFDNGATTTVTAVPTETIGQLLVSNNTTVNLQSAAASNILTIGGGTGTDLSVASGSALNNTGANIMTITVATGATGSIAGNMTLSGAAHRLDAADASGITFSSPSVFTQGTSCTGNVFTAAGTANAIVFGIGTTFIQNAGANPFGLTQPASKVLFQTGSLFRIQQNSAPGLSGRTYANFEISFAAFSQSPIGGNPLTMDNLTITDGTLNLNLTGGINIRGNVSVATGEVLTFSPASANTISLNGTTAQSITNSGTLTFATNASLTLNNSNGITLNSPISLGTAGVLTLTSGRITLGNNNLVLTNNSPTGAIGGYSSTSYIVTNGTGVLQRAVSAAGTYAFPVGTATKLQENSIAFAAPLGAANTLAARFIFGDGGNNGLPLSESGDNINHLSPEGFWEINPGSAFADAYTGTFVANQFNAVLNFAELHLVKRANGAAPWTLDGTHVTTTGSNALATLQRTGMSGFSQFGVAGELNIALPVKFSNVKAYQQGTGIRVEWSNLTEIDVLDYKVERSGDARSFAPLSTQAALKNDGGRADYSFFDALPVNGVNFYRIQSQEGNGQKLYSVIVRVDTRGGKMDIGIYPNPVSNGQLTLQAVDLPKGLYTLRIFNSGGQQVHTQQLNMNGGSVSEMIQLPASLKAGMYHLQLSNAELKFGKGFLLQ